MNTRRYLKVNTVVGARMLVVDEVFDPTSWWTRATAVLIAVILTLTVIVPRRNS